MDPFACLMRAYDALLSNDFEEVGQALTDYVSWRDSDGFEPVIEASQGATTGIARDLGGDNFAQLLSDALIWRHHGEANAKAASQFILRCMEALGQRMDVEVVNIAELEQQVLQRLKAKECP